MTDQSTFVLSAQTRTVVKKRVRALRASNIVPAIVYGHAQANQNVQLKLQDLAKVYQQAGESTLIDLSIDNADPIKVLIHSVSHDVLNNDIEHVDFYVVNMKEKIHAEVMLHFVGTAAAVKELGGTLVKNKDHIAVKCLPQDLLREVEVDITGLQTFDDVIHVEDVQLPGTVEVLDEPKDVVALVAAPRTEEELAALNEAVSEDVSKVEGVAEEPKAEVGAETEKSEGVESTAKE